jgi:hypothetical protein
MTKLHEGMRTRAQHQAWRREQDHMAAQTRARFREVTDRLMIPERARGSVVEALMEAARFHSMECAYANYELRTGCTYPPERREAEESQERRDWSECMSRLDAALRS